VKTQGREKSFPKSEIEGWRLVHELKMRQVKQANTFYSH